MPRPDDDLAPHGKRSVSLDELVVEIQADDVCLFFQPEFVRRAVFDEEYMLADKVDALFFCSRCATCKYSFAFRFKQEKQLMQRERTFLAECLDFAMNADAAFVVYVLFDRLDFGLPERISGRHEALHLLQ